MLSIQGRELVLWLHVLAATIWIGGQVTVAAVIPLLRGQPGSRRWWRRSTGGDRGVTR